MRRLYRRRHVPALGRFIEGFVMSISISIPDHAAYGADESLPDRPAPMSMSDAAYKVVHDAPGGVHALAARMGVSANTLTHKVNPNNTTHHLHPQELLDIQLFSGNHYVLHAMAHALGYTCTRATPDQSEGDPIEASMHMTMAWCELVRAFADAVLKGKQSVSRNEMRRVEYHAQEAVAAINHAMSTLRARMRTAPKVD